MGTLLIVYHKFNVYVNVSYHKNEISTRVMNLVVSPNLRTLLTWTFERFPQPSNGSVKIFIERPASKLYETSWEADGKERELRDIRATFLEIHSRGAVLGIYSPLEGKSSERVINCKGEGGHRMANQEHLNILKQGVKAWNEWRKQHYKFVADLTNIPDELKGANLSEVNFMNTNLDWTNLWQSDLSKANLSYTGFIRTNLQEANLNEADLSSATMAGAFLEEATLKKAILRETNLTKADLSGADLSGANL